MGATVVLRPATTSVNPGGESSIELLIRNTGEVVDQFSISVVGEAAGWAEASPPAVSLFPGAEQTARVTFRPPRSSKVPSGEVPFGVKVNSQEDPEGSVVEESVIDVAEFVDVGAELIPASSQGRKRGTHSLAVDNRGNARAPVSLMAVDNNEFLRLNVEPSSLDAEPGTASFAKLRVKAPKGFWTGSMRSHPFNVYVSQNGTEPIPVQGTFLQKPRIPRWLPKAILALILLVIAGVLAWFFLLKPTVESAAKDSAEDAIAGPIAEQNKALAAQQAGLAEQAKVLEGLTGQPVPVPSPVIPGEFADVPTDGRLQVSTSPGSPILSRITSSTVPANRTLSITDLVFQNPDGDKGLVRVFRNSDEMFRLRAENFRDLDYHFVTPLVFNQNDKLTLRVDCDEAADGACTIGIYYSGSMRTE